MPKVGKNTLQTHTFPDPYFSALDNQDGVTIAFIVARDLLRFRRITYSVGTNTVANGNAGPVDLRKRLLGCISVEINGDMISMPFLRRTTCKHIINKSYTVTVHLDSV